MNYNLRWDMLGPPVNVGSAIQAGFERGATRSALSDLVQDPTNEGALSRLAMFDPQSALQYRERATQERFRQATRSAFDPASGQIDPARMRQAYADAGNVAGAIEFDQNRAQAARTQQTAQRERLLQVARLLDDSTDEATYQRNRQTAISALGMNAADIPETYDPAWVDQQRNLARALSSQQEMTPFMREFQAAGYDLNSPEGQAQFRTMLQNRYAPPMQAVDVTNPDGSVTRQFIPRPQTGGAPPPLTDADFADEGGASPSNGSGGFPR